MEEALLREYQRAIQSDPRSKLFARLAEELVTRGRAAEAEAVTRQGVTFHPDFTEGRLARARALIALSRFTEARNEAALAAKNAPHSAESFAVLGQALALEGILDKATKACEKALRLSPGQALAQRILSTLQSPAEGGTRKMAAAEHASVSPGAPVPTEPGGPPGPGPGSITMPREAVPEEFTSPPPEEEVIESEPTGPSRFPAANTALLGHMAEETLERPLPLFEEVPPEPGPPPAPPAPLETFTELRPGEAGQPPWVAEVQAIVDARNGAVELEEEDRRAGLPLRDLFAVIAVALLFLAAGIWALTSKAPPPPDLPAPKAEPVPVDQAPPPVPAPAPAPAPAPVPETPALDLNAAAPPAPAPPPKVVPPRPDKKKKPAPVKRHKGR